ncbi:hypothetical protein SDC9_107444 [bioreactor metagenome]|uniref:Uncharacterized protein n=1 Tax=bioreactor metagenome TaxID=1076179 RepID=A0A645B589_9ZZZZ
MPKMTISAPMTQGSHLPMPERSADAAAVVCVGVGVETGGTLAAAAPAKAGPSSPRPPSTSEATSAGNTDGTVPPGVRYDTNLGSSPPTADITCSRGRSRRETIADSNPPPPPNMDSNCALLGICGADDVPSQLCTRPSSPSLRRR